MTDETTKIMAKANETMARNSRERLDLIRKVAVGETTREMAQELLEAQEERDNELIAEVDRKIEKLERELEVLEKESEKSKGNRIYWLLSIPIILGGSLAVWVLISLLRGGYDAMP